MGLKEKDIHLRVSMEEKLYLDSLENQSLYIRDLINKDRLDRLDNTFIDNKIKEHQESIKELQSLKKVKTSNEKDIHELLAYHAPAFKQNAVARSQAQRIRFIDKMILPDLKKLGSKISIQQIDELLLNWPEV